VGSGASRLLLPSVELRGGRFDEDGSEPVEGGRLPIPCRRALNLRFTVAFMAAAGG
jgi:hypothetical protein